MRFNLSHSQPTPVKIDAHCHAYGFSEKELEKLREITLVSVSEDYESSLQNIELSEKYPNIIPFIGIHPWMIRKYSEESFQKIRSLAIEGKAKGLGEVGIDRRYRKLQDKQVELFERFCQLSKELNLPMNIHALDAWREVLSLLHRHDVGKALFHWYTGPIELLREIQASGYYISINPSVKIQPKHLKILEHASLDMILTESDGPYRYHGLTLNPGMIDELLETIAEVKDMSVRDVEKTVERNFKRFIS